MFWVLQDLQNLQQQLKSVLPEELIVGLFVEVVEKVWIFHPLTNRYIIVVRII